MPDGVQDVSPTNNQAVDADAVYRFLYKDGFECAKAGIPAQLNVQEPMQKIPSEKVSSGQGR